MAQDYADVKMLKAKKVMMQNQIYNFPTIMKKNVCSQMEIFEHVNISDLCFSKSRNTWALVSAPPLITNI